MHSYHSIDWRDVAETRLAPEVEVDPRRRLRRLAIGFVLLALVVFGRLVWLQWHDGDEYRRVAALPIERRQSIPGIRGRILGRDGSVLAVDEQLASLAVRYRWFEEPPNRSWLRAQARLRLPRSQRRDAARLAEAQRQVLDERAELHARLRELCGVSEAQWKTRTRQIQKRVEAIARRVNERRQQTAAQAANRQLAARSNNPPAESFWRRWQHRLNEALWPEEETSVAPIIVAEELAAHVIVAELPIEVVAEIEAHPERYPGAQVVAQWRRRYPAGELASHVLGHLGAPAGNRSSADVPAAVEHHAEDRVGRMGIEQQYQPQLHGSRGVHVELSHRDGTLVASRRQREPGVGRDLVLSLDPALQKAAETLLDSACRRRESLASSERTTPAGGAIVVLDVHSGAVLASASAPRFDPNLFAAPSADPSHQIGDLLADAAHPLFDRATRMALPAGSVFKPLTAVALLESGFAAEEPISCRGYFQHPEAMRCAVFKRLGVGHGEIDLAEALVQSCNVYFFHAAAELGPAPLVDWARRFGFGRTTSIDLPGEASGAVPHIMTRSTGSGWRLADTQALAIGQSSLTVTPLQVARFMAAIANGGRLVTPHVAEAWGLTEAVSGDAASTEDELGVAPPQPIPGLTPTTLEMLRRALLRVVADTRGTAHGTVYTDTVSIAGKTGTAETSAAREDHAWFAGYAPAENPKVAFVVALEHAGDGGTAAGPVARRLVETMHELGYFRRRLGAMADAR